MTSKAELKRQLKILSDCVSVSIYGMDMLFKDKRIPKDIGESLAKIVNQLDLFNDKARYGFLGVNFRTDDKAKAVKKILAKD